MGNAKHNTLTKREEEVLDLLLQGYSNNKIAEELSVSVHTIKAHVDSIFRKFGVHNKVQAAVYAVRNNII